MNLIRRVAQTRLQDFLNDCERGAQLRRGGLSYRAIWGRLAERRSICAQIRAGNSVLHFNQLLVESLNPQSFTMLYDEIFLQDAYCFRAKKPRPRIIDCGANIGLALLYFKRQHPESVVVGFEPHPAAYAIAVKNISMNQISGVELIQAAVSDAEGSASLKFIPGEIMASTLTTRLHVRGCDVEEAQVKVVRLRDYLAEPVDFLKMDIEGAEARVLVDCEDLLGNVDKVFVEGHWTKGQKENTAAAIVGVLERSGFNVLIVSTETNRAHAFCPIGRVGPVTSFIVYGCR